MSKEKLGFDIANRMGRFLLPAKSCLSCHNHEHRSLRHTFKLCHSHTSVCFGIRSCDSAPSGEIPAHSRRPLKYDGRNVVMSLPWCRELRCLCVMRRLVFYAPTPPSYGGVCPKSESVPTFPRPFVASRRGAPPPLCRQSGEGRDFS